MSLHLHLSSHPDALLDSLRPALIAARKLTLSAGTAIPRPLPVLVPSAQLGDWLQIRLARDFGLSMGFEFLQPAAYFSRHFASTPDAAALAAGYTQWAPDTLRWHILPWVDAFASHLGHDGKTPLAPRDRFAFAQLLAGQLDRYARFRPEWPAAWSQPSSPSARAALSSDERWQRELWRALATQPDFPPHPAQQLAALATSASDSTPDAPGASDSRRQPLFIVGADLLDPLLLRAVQVLSHQGQAISLYLLLPSLGYLGDQTRRQQLNTLLDVSPVSGEEPVEFGGHPLLSSLGQQAVGHFLLLEELSPDYSDWPEVTDTFDPAPANATLLRRLQADIRAQRTPAGAPISPDTPDLRPPLDAADHSLRVHSCHSPRRELEVLRDELLRAFDELPGLQPEEVLVAVSDFDLYAPLAEAILRGGERPLPVRLTAIPARETNPVAVALLALLKLSVGRHTASELIELLTLSAVQQHLDLADKPEALAHLANTVRASGLTHDIDAADRASADATGTWRAAFDRHLAGAWFGPVAGALDASAGFVHPIAPDLHHDDASRLRFITWLTRLADQQLAWKIDAPAARWSERLLASVDTLLTAPELDDHAAAVRRTLGELARVTADTPLDAGALIDWLQPALENATSLRTSMGGEILLGRLNQLHGLPCRVFAFLGLQDGAFPRASRRPSWDLLATAPERWDADPRRQDRQWFLDTLLTPADRLILTAANRSLRTAHDGPLSACVEELLRAATATVRPSSDAPDASSVVKTLLVSHPIQPFATEYFSTPSSLPVSFDTRAAEIALALYQPDALPDLAPFMPSPFPADAAPAVSSAAEPLSLTLAQLSSFWKDPARAWLKALRIDVPEGDTDDTTLDDAPLSLDGLQAYLAGDAALRSLLPHPLLGPAEAGDRLIADRALPPGALGALAWRSKATHVAPLADTLTPLLRLARPTPFLLPLDATAELAGELRLGSIDPDHAHDWVLVFRPGKYDRKPRYQIDAWLHTLAAAAVLDRPVACVIASLDDHGSLKTLPPLDPASARRQLTVLLAGYRDGQSAPLPYAPDTSALIAKNLSGHGDDDAALASASADWSKPAQLVSPAGEGHAPAAQLAWRDTDPFAAPHAAAWLAWARAVSAPLALWWDSDEPPKKTKTSDAPSAA